MQDVGNFGFVPVLPPKGWEIVNSYSGWSERSKKPKFPLWTGKFRGRIWNSDPGQVPMREEFQIPAPAEADGGKKSKFLPLRRPEVEESKPGNASRSCRRQREEAGASWNAERRTSPPTRLVGCGLVLRRATPHPALRLRGR